MSVECFLDTNVLVYSVSAAPDEQKKRRKALEIMERGTFALSAQVLQEFFVTVTRKTLQTVSAETAMAWVDELSHAPCLAIDADLVKLGIACSRRYRISYWDGAILAAAETLRADTVYSEDLNHGQSYGSVHVINPFLEGQA